MGTTDNFDSSAATLSVATSTFPVLLANNAGARNHTLSQITPYVGKYRWLNVGSANLGALTGIDTNGTTLSADTTYFTDVFIPLASVTLTGIGILNGTTVGTDKGFVMLFNSAGTLLANSSVTSGGATTSGASTFQQRAFTAPYTTLAPGRYWIGYQGNGTTDTVRMVAAATWVDVLTGSVAGANAVATASITPATTFTAAKGPLSYVY